MTGQGEEAPWRQRTLDERLPVAHRELAVEARNPLTDAYRLTLGAAILLGCALLFWGVHLIGIVAGSGGDLFTLLAHGVGFVGVMTCSATSATSLSKERKDGTLGLLFLTRLRTIDIVLGKLISSSVQTLTLVFAALPVLAICLLLGGVTGESLALTSLAIVNGLFLALTLGLFVSTFCRDTTTAQGWAGVGIVLLVVVLPLLARAAQAHTLTILFAPWLETLSHYTCLRLGCGVGVASNVNYWVSLATIHAMAHLFLWGSVWLLPRSWRAELGGAKFKFFDPEKWRQKRYGKPEWRGSFRKTALDQDPIFWVLTRDRHSRAAIPRVVFCVAAALLIWGAYDPGAVKRLAPFLLLMMELQLKGLASMILAKQLMDDRESGALGMILGKGVTLDELVEGVRKSMRHRLLIAFIMYQALIWIAGAAAYTVYGVGKTAHLWHGAGGLLCYTIVSITQIPAFVWITVCIPTVSGNPKQHLAAPMLLPVIPIGLLALTAIPLLMTGILQQFRGPAMFWILVGVWVFYSLLCNFIATIWAKRTFHAKAGEQAMKPPTPQKDNPLEGLAEFLRRRLERKPIAKEREDEDVKRWAKALRHWKLIGIVSVIAFIGLAIYNRHLSGRIDAQLTTLSDGGILLNDEETAALYPEVGESENAGLLFDKAARQLVFLSIISTNRNSALSLWKGDFEPPSEEEETLRSLYVKTNAIALATLERLGASTMSRFDSGTPFTIEWQRNSPTRTAASELFILQLLTVNERNASGDEEAALACLAAMPEAGLILMNEPSMDAQYERLSAFRYFRFALRDHVRSATLTDAQIDRLLGAIERAQRLGERRFRDAMKWEFAGTVAELREQDLASMTGGSSADYLMAVMMGSIDFLGFRERALLDYADWFDASHAAALTPLEERARRIRGAPPIDFNGLFAWRAPPSARTIQQALDSSVMFAAYLEIDRAVLLIERYRNAHQGTLPGYWDDLRKASIPVPLDPITGRPLKYKRTDEGYLIYSVGLNGTDEGGDDRAGPPRFAPRDLPLEVRFDLLERR